jgi:DNA-binding beta-propeller fold protein YncE
MPCRLTVAAFLLLCAVPAAGSAPPPLTGAQVGPACRTSAIPYPQNALTETAGSLWLACRDGSRVERRTPAGKLVATIRTPGFRPWAIASAGGAVWVVDRDQPLLVRISTRTNKLVKRIRIPEAPIYVWGGSSVAWLAFDGSGSVARVTTSTNRVGARVFVGDGPSGFAAGAATWVLSHRDGALVRFDGTRPKTLRRQQADERRTPERMARAGNSLWITGRGLDLVRVDPDTGAERSTTEIGAAGIDVVSVAGRLAVISATEAGARRGDPIVAAVSWVDAATGTVLRASEATSATSLTGIAVTGGKLVVLDGLHGRLLTLTP